MMKRRTALLVTYTMTRPGAVVGVFFRALRLARELTRRGWHCVIVNHGTIPSDPKVSEARERGTTILPFTGIDPASDFRHGVELFRGIDPDLILFGEYPFATLQPLFRACRALARPPLMVIDQYYSPESGSRLGGVDLFVMYGVRMWPGAPLGHPSYRVVPPFIDRVAPKEELPVPAHHRDRPWITVAGFDERVLQAGVEILGRLRDRGALGITISHDPEAADHRMAEAGVPRDRRLALPLQRDEQYFGLIAASRAVVLANGFMQLVEAVALGCPAVCIHRGAGMDGFQLHESFQPLVTFADDVEDRVAAVDAWLRESPFPPELRARLASERGGIAAVADLVDELAARPRRSARLARRGIEWGRRLAFRRSADETA